MIIIYLFNHLRLHHDDGKVDLPNGTRYVPPHAQQILDFNKTIRYTYHIQWYPSLRLRSISSQKNPMSNFFNGLKFLLIYLAYMEWHKWLYCIQFFFHSFQSRSYFHSIEFHFIALDFLKLHLKSKSCEWKEWRNERMDLVLQM